MRPENVHGYTFPNALTSFAVEERSKDHFTVVILSLVVFINFLSIYELSPTFVVKRLTSFCTVESYPAVQLTVSVCGAVDLIDAFESSTTHMLQSTWCCIRRVITQCKSYNGKLFLRG